jgi:glycine/D-amino acid oxidase-like deaminating enzyme
VRTVLEALAADVETATVVPGSYQPCTRGCVTTPDGLPVLDAPAGTPDGLVVATAVTGGISMSPFTGAAVRALVTGADPPVPLAPFAADRFDEPRADFRVHGIREPLSAPDADDG